MNNYFPFNTISFHRNTKYGKDLFLEDFSQDVLNAYNILQDCKLSILCCNSTYPNLNYNEIDLQLIPIYKKRYPNCSIGYRGHEIGILPSIVAYSMGAEIIERHITLNKNMQGADHKASLEPNELKELITSMKYIDQMKTGKDIKTLYKTEIEMKNKLKGK